MAYEFNDNIKNCVYYFVQWHSNEKNTNREKHDGNEFGVGRFARNCTISIIALVRECTWASRSRPNGWWIIVAFICDFC